MTEPWWKKSVVYQIYPKSFYDTTGNGTGDLQGIIAKLDYLKELGVDIIWLTPVYDSPQRDNGYDIRDYYQIYKEYGTMEDFDRLLEEAHSRGIKIIMDLVVNHSSIEHEWFQDALKSKDSRYRNYYIWKDPREDGSAPTNWESKFGGNAWEYDGATGQYYLHLFDVTQADLNWENEQLRNDVYEMMHYWFKKGIDGFRLDVINLISKDQDFPDDDGSVPPGDGRKFYTDGPKVHQYLQEMNSEVLSKYDSMTVGEMSSTTIENCIKYSNPDRNELSMTFNFHHLKVDYENGDKWTLVDFDFLALKRILSLWQVEMHKGGGWNALFWCNHDQPRVVSRYGNDGQYHRESAKMLGTAVHMMQGTPYIYQGEEIGMTNPYFERIEDYRDVESLNIYKIKMGEGMSKEEILKILQSKSRDNSRTPVHWNDEKHAGFTSGTPWIDVARNYQTVNVENALADKNSVFYHYKTLIQLRKQYDIITYGDYQLLLEEHPDIFAYVRNGQNEKLLVVNNFYGKDTIFELPDSVDADGYQAEILLSNYEDSTSDISAINLRPYESIVYHLTK
ncbi:alpha,alpha-phosphotrehalase [Mesobacillus selenatarsenatis]|uniref:Alpha,alpha-phosphotrehalase n=1 Tax=Mesobacillus selenatarsenatis (strain DSM 18680 / JCM 14380 / FERM P-15431 / SF-1) TaxID=1321606 RepID=A0A0A8WZ65_MESS1|nr:alpha,alpha-phosphotrehalase [Mesobacillus selenatarsenatis]GAM12918.1 trehalose-6-phosphate hydrolase [Mesobacillus selenatarsenatis SF-1]